MKKLLVVTGLLVMFLSSCSKERDPGDNPEYNKKVNEFVTEAMTKAYYWSDAVKNRTIVATESPFFNFELYRYEKDKWSFLVDLRQTEQVWFNGKSKTSGFDATYFFVDGSREINASVRYVLSGSPAEQAGLKRGDVIMRVNDNEITLENAVDFINATDAVYAVKRPYIDGSGKIAFNSPFEVRVVAEAGAFNTVAASKTFDVSGKKIGYICYTSFDNPNDTNIYPGLTTAAGALKGDGITELILDLRYNRGGRVDAAEFLCSILAPKAIVESNNILTRNEWSSYYQPIYENTSDDSRLYSRVRAVYAQKNIGVNKIYILTAEATASASEMTILGLKPYADITVIGTTTKGKSYAVSSVSSTKDDEDLKQWLVNCVVYQWYNSRSISPVNGIVPDIEIADLTISTYQLGDANDPVIAKALNVASGYKAAETTPYIDNNKTINTDGGVLYFKQ